MEKNVAGVIMEEVKKTDQYIIYKKRNGRFGVRGNDRKWINGADKIKILVEHGLIKAAMPKAPEPEAAPEAEAPAQEATEAPAE